ncbi:cysteine synthase A [Enteroscipio rubneri]|uniref:Cysteine synthase n=1 Tax=Enteroscipio rubneri TaxID=2070686 RepID=A0A2K2UDP7_9ACTN|nr:cysteine synthase A [Enteroscipio rubneri]PNV68433.1 cysteine synthase A [Enteroscipio rubneri]
MTADLLSQAIGDTPLIGLDALSKEVGAQVFAKYEAANPGASIKDRAARSMIDRAEERGEIEPGRTVLVEPTSGNTGIAIAMIGAARGYDVVIVMPDSMSRERRMLMAAYGARLELTPGSEGMAGSVARAEELSRKLPGAWIVGQFANPDNPRAHEETTGPEIVRQLGRFPDYVVAGAGTGGTISGIAHYLRAQGASTRFFAVEPAESPLVSQALAGAKLVPAPHGIQGIGANFIPATLDLDVLDGALSVSTEEAREAGRMLAAREGVLAGISSGANAAAVRRLVEDHPEARGTVIVTFAVDTGERYLSTSLFE